MTIDWTKPIQYRLKVGGEVRWVDARVLCTDRKGEDAERIVVLYTERSGTEHIRTLTEDGKLFRNANVSRVRNKPLIKHYNKAIYCHKDNVQGYRDGLYGIPMCMLTTTSLDAWKHTHPDYHIFKWVDGVEVEL